jgi:hypothetical protein
MFGFCAVSSEAAQVKTMASTIAIDFIVGAPFSITKGNRASSVPADRGM